MPTAVLIFSSFAHVILLKLSDKPYVILVHTSYKVIIINILGLGKSNVSVEIYGLLSFKAVKIFGQQYSRVLVIELLHKKFLLFFCAVIVHIIYNVFVIE